MREDENDSAGWLPMSTSDFENGDEDSTVNSVLECMVYMLRHFKYLTKEEARDLFEEASGHSETTSRLDMTYFIHTLVDTLKINKETT